MPMRMPSCEFKITSYAILYSSKEMLAQCIDVEIVEVSFNALQQCRGTF